MRWVISLSVTLAIGLIIQPAWAQGRGGGAGFRGGAGPRGGGLRGFTERGFRQGPPQAGRPGRGEGGFRGEGRDALDNARDVRERQWERSREATERAAEQSREQAERLREQQLEAAERRRELVTEQAELRREAHENRGRGEFDAGEAFDAGRRGGPPPHALQQQRRAAEQALSARLDAAARLRDVAGQSGSVGPQSAADRIEQRAWEDYARHLERIERLSGPAVPATAP
jgi:hypothetical protein